MLRLAALTLLLAFVAAAPSSGLFGHKGNLRDEVKKQINTPGPFRAKVESPQAFLTVQGVVDETNAQRTKFGLPALIVNPLLNNSASTKVQDMFAKQYFAHSSPDGRGVGELATTVDYDYIAIGENLALGNFQNDKVLTQAWMDSPGHRANILNNRYQEIGVAVLRGTYEGKSTWMAVQHFGLPLSACPSPDGWVKQKIDTNQNLLGELEKELKVKEEDLNKTEPKNGPEYNRKVDEYNALVKQYNDLVSETKGLIEKYNSQVANFNRCAANPG